jgi:carboxymethylenebutenolidase
MAPRAVPPPGHGPHRIIIGLFGAEDQTPSPAQVAELEHALKASGKTYEFRSYEGAGHGFFAADRPSYRAAAAADGQRRILTWLARYLEG